MNPSPKSDSNAIRSDIDQTRRRMDETMDELGDRLKPKHLLDEVLGFFRSHDGEARLASMRDSITRSADSAAHAVATTVKNNPVPLLLIGAGVAWMIYDSRRDKSDHDDDREPRDERLRYDPDTHYDRQLQYPASYASAEDEPDTEGRSKLGELKDTLGEKASAATEQVKDKLAHAGDVAKEKLQGVTDRAREVTTRVKDSTRQAYTRTRDRVVETTDQHPLEVGLVALAAGLIAGLALPTPNVVHRTVGRTADRLRDRTRETGGEMLEKGKRVARAAVDAVKGEAEAQGLTPDRLRRKAEAIAERGAEAGEAAARREGLAAGSSSPGSSTPMTPRPEDPSAARPAI